MKACRALDDRACATVKTRSQRPPKASRSQSLCDKTSPGCSSGVGGRGHAPGRGRPRQARRPRGLGCSQLSLPPTSRSVSRLLRRPAGAGARGTQWYREEERGGARARIFYASLPTADATAAETLQTRRLSNSMGLFREGVSPLPAARQSVADTGGLGPSAGSSGDSKFPPEAKAPPRLRPCNKCSPGSAGASPGLCTPGARSPR